MDGETFHISTDEFVSIRKLVKKIVDMTGANFDAVVTAGEERLGKDQVYFLDLNKIVHYLTGLTLFLLSRELEETISWVRDNLDVLQGKGDWLCSPTLNQPLKRT